MTLFDIFFLALALAMDCFTVSIAGGMMVGRWQPFVFLRMALLFGLFQAAMPLLGWLLCSYFARYIEAYDHWVAFGLLLFLGGRMVLSSFRPEEAPRSFNPRRLTTQLTLAVATSIDALAVGITFAAMGYNGIAPLLLPLFVIGIMSFLLSVAGSLLGVRFGVAVSRMIKPELLGGLILIAIGVKVLLSHLL
ncbi:MAG: manganese efflux pump [Prevotella sp.]|nr:manganese efflux pump [Prevotella sp.]